MAFQGWSFDADQNVVDRRVIPYPYPNRKEAVDAIESVVTSFPQSGYQSENYSWWALTRDDTTRIRFAIETVWLALGLPPGPNGGNYNARAKVWLTSSQVTTSLACKPAEG